MDAQYQVDVLLIRIHHKVALEVDSQVKFIDLYEGMYDYFHNPLINPIAYIVDLNKTITNPQLCFRDLGLKDGAHIKIYIYDSKVLPLELKNPPQIVNRINLILKDLNDQPIQINHIGLKHTLNDAIEFLLSQCGFKFIALTRYRVSFIMIKIKSSSHCDYFDESTSFKDLYQKAKKRIKCPIDQGLFEICNVLEIVNYQKYLQFQEMFPNNQYQAQIIVKYYSKAVYDLIKANEQQEQYDKIIEKQMKAEEQQKIKHIIELSELQEIQQPFIQEELQYQNNPINLIFEIIDGDVKYVQSIKIDLSKTLKETKEILIHLYHPTNSRNYLDIVFHKPNCDTFFNTKELEMQLYQLKLKDYDKIRCRISYAD